MKHTRARPKELVLLIGIQASGKSTFCRERLFRTHLRINRDMLRTRNRERKLVETCLAIGQPFVVDNTNASREERERFIPDAKAAGFSVVGYFFDSDLPTCMERNKQREGEELIPDVGVRSTFKRLEEPTFEEGFDQLFFVRTNEAGFVVEEQPDLE